MRLYCPRCGNDIVKSYPDGKVKLRTNILIFEDGKALCKCQKCKADVKVPVTLMTPETKKVKFYVLEEKHEKSEKSEVDKTE